MEKFKKYIPHELWERGRIMKETGGYEIAWRKPDVLRIIESLDANIIILGGDVYRSDNDWYEPTYDNWYCEIKQNESQIDYAERSRKESSNYIARYQEDHQYSYLYVLVFSF